MVSRRRSRIVWTSRCESSERMTISTNQVLSCKPVRTSVPPAAKYDQCDVICLVRSHSTIAGAIRRSPANTMNRPVPARVPRQRRKGKSSTSSA